MAGAAKAGPEFRINTTTRGAQIYSDVTALANGGFAVAFMSPSIKADNTLGANDIRARVFGPNLLPLAPDFAIATQPDELTQVFDHNVALAPSGSGFVAVWNAPFGGNSSSIVAEIFNTSGTGGGEFQVNPGSNWFHFPDVALSTAGSHLVVWDDAGQSGVDTGGSGILARINGVGPLITINTTTAGEQTAATVAALQDAGGRFVVTWRSVNPVTQDVDIKAQLISPTGAKVGGEITVAADVYHGESTVAAGLVGGGFAIAYFDRYTIEGKIFDSNGQALTGSFDISAPNAYYAPAIAGLSNRLIAVAYEYFNDFQAMFVKTFAPDGTQVGTTLTFDANNGVQAGANYAGQPSIAALPNGRFVITWTDTSTAVFEPNAVEAGAAIVGQIYNSTAPTFIDGTVANNTFNGVTQTGMFLGYNGVDTVSYATAGAKLVANMANPSGSSGVAAGDSFGVTIENLIGSNFADTLIGNVSGNRLDGGGQGDVMRGGGGNDIYIVNHAGDFVDEQTNGGAGVDLVQSSVSFNMATRTVGPVENLTLTNVATALTATGNASNNIITGNNFNNTLTGGLGADSLRGGLGNDTYVLESGADTVIDTGGTADAATTTISRSLNGYATIEQLTLLGTAAINGTGNALANVITGNVANNVLNGGAGADTLIGRAGNDTLIGGVGNDFFVFNAAPNASTNRDVIADFGNVGGNNDTFQLENSVFVKLGAAGPLNPAFFKAAATAADANDYIVYNKATGALFYDVNGNAAGGAVQLATLVGKPTLTPADFVVI